LAALWAIGPAITFQKELTEEHRYFHSQAKTRYSEFELRFFQAQKVDTAACVASDDDVVGIGNRT